jgi:hypothetical protein
MTILARPGTVQTPPPMPQPRDQLIGPGTPFAVPRDGVVGFEFASTTLASLVLEVQAGAAYVASRVLNTHQLEGTTTAVLSPGTWRVNNTGPGIASVVVTAPDAPL